MSDPYEVLGLPRTADEGETRRRYLELVRQFPPDRDPVRRLENQLFQADSGETIAAIDADLRARLRDRLNHLPLEALLAMAESP